MLEFIIDYQEYYLEKTYQYERAQEIKEKKRQLELQSRKNSVKLTNFKHKGFDFAG